MKPTQRNPNAHPSLVTPALLTLFLGSLLIAITCAGCKQEANVPAEPNPVGAYALVSVNGNKVPCTVQHDGHTLTVKSGAFAFNADQTCSSKMAFSLPQGGDASREVKATYARQGSKLTMSWEGAGTTTGTLVGDTFTMDNEGMMLAYRKSREAEPGPAAGSGR